MSVISETAEMATMSEWFVHEAGAPGRPAVVFLHGAGASGRMWLGHLDRLQDRFHCLAPDLPGFGRSAALPPLSIDETADHVAELIAMRVPEGRASIVGLSWGGGVAHRLLARHPELVERAVIDCAGLLTARSGPLIVLGVRAISPFLHSRPVVALFSRMIGMDEDGRADLRAAAPRAFRRAFVEGFKGGVLPREIDATCPTLLTAGEKESAIRSSNAAQAALMPDAEARFAPGLGHGWIARGPDLHVRMVEAWLIGTELPAQLSVELPAERSWPEALDRMRRELEEARHGDQRLAARIGQG